jgi:hypothetical protein
MKLSKNDKRGEIVSQFLSSIDLVCARLSDAIFNRVED